MATLIAVDKGELARLLTELMASRSLSQAELARRSGVSQTHISRILSGENLPSPTILDQLAAALDVEPAHLHRAYATSIGLRLDIEEIVDDDLIALIAIWPGIPVEQRRAQRAALEAILRSLRD